MKAKVQFNDTFAVMARKTSYESATSVVVESIG